MIIVLGSVVVRDSLIDAAVRLSREHVHRSRAEAGCLSHAVHRDCENPARLVFVEEWTDETSLRQHFTVPESRAFVAALGPMAVEAPSMTIYNSKRVVL
jgi:quinol monooxygenase YgiN